jgi:hypothetical protein
VAPILWNFLLFIVKPQNFRMKKNQIVLQGKKQFLSPAIETKAIQKLAEYMTVYNKEDLTTNQLVPFVLICLVPARLPRL